MLADGLLSGATAPSPGAHFVAPRMERGRPSQNVRTARALVDMAAQKRCTTAQLALAWLRARGDDIVPLVGISRRARLDENLALDVRVSRDDYTQLDAAFAAGAIVGNRYPSFVMKYAAR